MNELIAIQKIAGWEPIPKRVYNMALDEFLGWFRQAPRPGFTKATVSAWRVSLEGRLFLVADDEDARGAMERFGARRGEIYIAAEARRIIAVRDPAIVAEIHDWRQRCDGVVRELRAGEQLK
jgi:hypothetical protein